MSGKKVNPFMRNFRFYFSIALLIFGLVASANAQKLAYGGKPKPAPKIANAESYYAELPNKMRVYKFQNDTDDERQIYFEIRNGAKTLGKIDASINAFGSQLDDFHAFYGDLDKNKSAELVIVDFDGQSLGLGVNRYTINIFPDFETKGFSQPLTFNTSEFGKDGTFVYDAKTNETLILLTEWGGVQIKSNSKSGRDGMYFTGRFFRLKDGKLKPAADKPMLARRYLNSFVKERFRTDKSPLRPLNWLSSPSVIKLKGDPVFNEKPLTTESGVIEKFEELVEKAAPENGDNGREIPFSQIVVRFESGERKTIVIAKNDYYDKLTGQEQKIVPETFGILPAKMTLPTDFSPLLVFDRLEGKQIQLNGYLREEETTPVYKLWFIE